MARILLVEDDPGLGQSLLLHFKAAGHEVLWETNLASARARVGSQPVDVLVLDVGLPDGSGLDFCAELRRSGSRLPILILTAHSEEEVAVAGFTAGASDFVRKPFRGLELLARIQSQLKAPLRADSRLRVGPLLLLPEELKVVVDGNEVHLNRREFSIFVELAKSMGRVLSRHQLAQVVGNPDGILDRTVDSHLSHIRAKFKSKAVDKVIIRSVYGIGYTLEVA